MLEYTSAKGRIYSLYKIECYACDNAEEISDIKDYISPRLTTDWITALKEHGWKLTNKGWKCPNCKKQILMTI